MCEITTHGYKMKDGTIIPFKKLNMGDVSPDHVEEMNRASASVWDVVLLRNTIFGLKDEIKKDVNESIGKLTEAFEKHGNYCPVNKDKVKYLINEEIEKNNNAKIKKGSRVVEYIWKAAVAILVLINLVFILLGKSPIQITP